jgi:hypothetical protein
MSQERPETERDEVTAPQAEVEESVQPEVQETAATTLVEVRRAPKYWNFMVLFAVLCGIAVTIITFALPYDARTAGYSRGTVYGFALLFAVALGLALGALVALLAERLSRRSIRLVEAEQITGKQRHPER